MVFDELSRPLRSLRLSVTDRCNLRCSYCMPEREYVWLPRADLLTFAELRAITRVFTELGVDRVRITGGEPLLRNDIEVLIGMLAALPGLSDVALTTNGLELPRLAGKLRQAGLHRVTISLDTLQRDRFRKLTGRDRLPDVLSGIDAALAASLRSVKINTVVMRGTNEDEIGPLLEFARARGVEIRFIEYMDVGGATHWQPHSVFSRREVLAAIEERFGPVRVLPSESSAPADRFALADGTVFGVISSTTAPFCRSCDRARLTADGVFYTCLYARTGLDLRAPIRAGAAPEELARLIETTWRRRTDRGAEERLAVAERRPLAAAAELRRDPHLEMHTRGG
jgi:cyclic pyranopterin phosphate synthase